MGLLSKESQDFFQKEHVLFWSNLSRMNGLLIILNISMFFLTGLVNQGYYYTCFSLAGLALVGVVLLIPTKLVQSVYYYSFILFVELIALYFFLSSIVFWVGQNRHF